MNIYEFQRGIMIVPTAIYASFLDVKAKVAILLENAFLHLARILSRQSIAIPYIIERSSLAPSLTPTSRTNKERRLSLHCVVFNMRVNNFLDLLYVIPPIT